MDQENHQETPPATSDGSSSMVKIVIAVVVVAVIAVAVWQFGLKGNEASDTESVTQQPTNSSDLPSVGEGSGESMTASRYNDGTFKATGQYQNPASSEDVNISVTLEDGVITAATFEGTPDNPTTRLMQNNFNDGFEEEVVGKPIDEADLTVVNGSSLTPRGFMDALENIKEQAKA